MCSFLCHEKHEFKDCKCNPKSNNYCGNHFNDVWKVSKVKKELNANEKEKESKTEDNDDAVAEFYDTN